MRRSTHTTPLDSVNDRVVVKYESREAPKGTSLYRAVQREILQTLLDGPGLLDCGLQPFEKLKVFHNGTAWIVELEATTSK
jgi:hypothetical protein